MAEKRDTSKQRPLNPSDQPSASDETKRLEDELRKQYEVQDEAKRAAARYTLKEAADIILTGAGERSSTILAKLVAAVEIGALPAYRPGERARVEYGNGPGRSSRVRTWYEEVYREDLSAWLKEHEPRVTIPDELAALAPPPTIKDSDRGGASGSRTDGLGRIIHSIVVRKPSITEKGLLSELQALVGKTTDGVTVESITDTEIEWRDDKQPAGSNPISGLKDRLSRAKQSAKSH